MRERKGKDNMLDKKYGELNTPERESFLEEYKTMARYVMVLGNSNASILTNWLYALSTSGIGTVIALSGKNSITGAKWLYAIWFLLSLFFCIISTAVEWLRWILYGKKINFTFVSFINGQISIDECSKKMREHAWWLWLVSVLRVLGYASLLIGICVLLFYRQR